MVRSGGWLRLRAPAGLGTALAHAATDGPALSETGMQPPPGAWHDNWPWPCISEMKMLPATGGRGRHDFLRPFFVLSAPLLSPRSPSRLCATSAGVKTPPWLNDAPPRHSTSKVVVPPVTGGEIPLLRRQHQQGQCTAALPRRPPRRRPAPTHPTPPRRSSRSSVGLRPSKRGSGCQYIAPGMPPSPDMDAGGASTPRHFQPPRHHPAGAFRLSAAVRAPVFLPLAPTPGHRPPLSVVLRHEAYFCAEQISPQIPNFRSGES